MIVKSPIDHIWKPVSKFINQEFTGGIILFVSVIIALVWANSPWSQSYHAFWDVKIAISIGGHGLNQPLHAWINDGLMALFFFVIGLELKREFMVGELSTIKKASLPMMAALGGMLFPALIYIFLNYNHNSSHGWGIPMATDIAFALGLLSLAGRHIPTSVKVFLSALAVADDLGAVLVIAVFYTHHISFLPLAIGLILLAVLWLGNRLGIRNMLFYLLVGLAVWACFLFSGLHATIAGVLVALMIPARTKINEAEYVFNVKQYTTQFEQAIPQDGSLTTAEQHITIERIKQLSQDAETPLQKIEHGLHPWVAFVIMPLFALANAGIQIDHHFFSSLANPVSLGISIGLVVGKFTGVLLFTWLMVKLKLSDMPQHANWGHLRGIAVLAGVGFTMSLFITGLAFNDSSMVKEAKYAILLASLFSGSVGLAMLKYTGRKT